MKRGAYEKWGASADVWQYSLPQKYWPTQCSCVKSIRHFGVNIPRGNASDFIGKQNSIPVVGAIVIFSYKTSDHLGLLDELAEEGFWMREGNGATRCAYGRRFVRYDDPALRGFWINPK